MMQKYTIRPGIERSTTTRGTQLASKAMKIEDANRCAFNRTS